MVAEKVVACWVVLTVICLRISFENELAGKLMVAVVSCVPR